MADIRNSTTLTAARLREVLLYDPNTGTFWWRVRTTNRIWATKPPCKICGKPSDSRSLCKKHYHAARYRGDLGRYPVLTQTDQVPAGRVAGTAKKLPGGRRYIGIDGRQYLASRLVWLYVHGEWPSKNVDHINGDAADDRICNLRLAEQSQNMANIGRPAHNTSGFKGVSFDKTRQKWVAQIKENKTHHFLGRFSTPEEAHAAYCEAAHRLHGDFARTE